MKSSAARAPKRSASRPAAARASHYLHPGQLFAAAEPWVISTILGTCVAVCLWDPLRRIGGMNHFLLPHLVSGAAASPRFGNVACQALLDEVLALGAARERLEAKVFGGMRGRSGAGPLADLGARNAAVAFEALREAGICVAAEDVGGEHGRRLIFQLDDGVAWVRKVGGGSGGLER